MRTHCCQTSGHVPCAHLKARIAQFFGPLCSGSVTLFWSSWKVESFHVVNVMLLSLELTSFQLPARHLCSVGCWDLQFKLVKTGLCTPDDPRPSNHTNTSLPTCHLQPLLWLFFCSSFLLSAVCKTWAISDWTLPSHSQTILQIKPIFHNSSSFLWHPGLLSIPLPLLWFC